MADIRNLHSENEVMEYLEFGSQLADPLVRLVDRVIEPRTQDNYVAIIVNIIWLVDQHTATYTCLRDRINLCEMILREIPELNDLEYVHRASVIRMYMLSENDKLRQVRPSRHARCCSIM